MSRAPARRRLVGFEHLTLDGVMQAPGRPDEDRRDGFEHGGWATLWDPVIASVAEESMASQPALLFGRRARAALRLVDVKASPSGVVIATYRSGAEDG